MVNPVDKVRRLYESGQYLRAAEAFLGALNDESVATSSDLGELYFLGSKIRMKQGQPHSSRGLLRLAEEHGTAAGNGSLLGQVWFNLVDCLRIVGDTAEALEVAERFTLNLGMYPEMEQYVGACIYNMALCHVQRRNHEEGIRCYRKAAELIDRAGNPRMSVMVRQNLSWWLLTEGHHDEAQTVITHTETVLGESEGLDDLRRNQLLITAYRLYCSKSYEAVRQMCEEFLAPGAESTTHQRFWCYWMLGNMYFDIGRQDLANHFWTYSNAAAIESGEPRLLNFASSLRARLLQNVDNGRP